VNRYFGIVLLVVGVVLFVLGWRQTESFTSELHELFKGTPSSSAIWLMAGGVILATLGLVPLFTSRGRA
jgi:hypothetical protein